MPTENERLAEINEEMEEALKAGEEALERSREDDIEVDD